MKTLLSIALALVPVTGAFAAPEEAPRIAVSYADLDLAKPQDAARLQHRVALAAREVCGGTPDIHNLSALTMSKQCRQAALQDAAPRIEVAMAAARNGERLASLDVSRPAMH